MVAPWQPKHINQSTKQKPRSCWPRPTQLQAAFWDALSELEDALGGIEIDGTRDLSETTIDELIDGEQDAR